ncbi:hypothetical protein QVD17_25883 [Tagetes erecta]|uniref:Uncharacterized protein n=1 Tax=Tagetes erecta TaxID=13708 RepID=A0AAD8K5U6_TARER|nr:hypothetical protein QVD17_25883 [Tagetes erecta]
MEEIQGFVISSCWRRLCSQEVQRVGVLLYAIVLPTIKKVEVCISYYTSRCIGARIETYRVNAKMFRTKLKERHMAVMDSQRMVKEETPSTSWQKCLLKEQAVVVIGADCNGSAFKKPCDYLPCLISQVITWRIKKRNPNGHNYGFTLHARLEMKDTFDLTWCSNMGIYFAVKSKVHV